MGICVLKTCPHPSVAFQVRDLERHIAARHAAAYPGWTPDRARRRPQVRADEAQQDADKASTALEDHAQQQLEEAKVHLENATLRLATRPSLNQSG